MVNFGSLSYESREYESKENHVLAAAVSGKKGEFYYLMVELGNVGTDSKKAVIYRANTDSSSIIREVNLDTDESGGLNMWELSTSCQMIFMEAEGTLTLYLSRYKKPNNRG